MASERRQSQDQDQKVALAAKFIDTEAPAFHGAFGSPSTLNKEMVQYDSSEIHDLRATLECHQRARKYVDFIHDLNKCTWDNVHEELRKAQESAIKSEERGKNYVRKAWRTIGLTSTILAPGLSAIPDDLCILNGGLALIFSLARHSELNRHKILAAFENVPNIIEMARNKAETLPLDDANPKSIQLHRAVQQLQQGLLQTLPALINKLVPGSFLNAWKSPFGGWKIDQLLDAVSVSADRVRLCAESLMEEIIVGNYATSMAIRSQLEEVLQQQRIMQMSINAAHGQTHLLHFLMEQLNVNQMGILCAGDQTDLSERGTAVSGYSPGDLLMIIDVNHLRVSSDARTVMRRGLAMDQADIERAASMVTEPQVKELLNNDSLSSVVAINGHFDRTQMGKISPLSYICTMVSQTLRQVSPPSTQPFTSSSPTSPQSQKPASASIVLEYFCALHTADDDDLRGPQGLVRCLTMQLILSMVANKWIGESEAMHLPHLRDGEEDMLAEQNLGAFCRLFGAVVRLIPNGVPIYCFIDGWSAYEREELWQTDCSEVLDGLRDAIEARGPDGGAAFKLLLTSPTASSGLDGFVQLSHRISLRSYNGRQGKLRSVLGRIKGSS